MSTKRSRARNRRVTDLTGNCARVEVEAGRAMRKNRKRNRITKKI
jgi:hypothetical protein